jgi:hypothetical protein
MLPELMSARRANSRAETPAESRSVHPVAVSTDATEDLWEQFEGLRSLRTQA